MAPRTLPLHPHVRAIMAETETDDPDIAVRVKARQLLASYLECVDETPPFNMEAFASFLDLRLTDKAPVHSDDSELVPLDDGTVELRVNQDRPVSRRRFSVGHEIGHTLFPDFELKVQCRKPIDRDWANPDDLIESLCDIAASEFLFPLPWFAEAAQQAADSASALADLARVYRASRDATARRFVELQSEPYAAIFLEWQLKPTQRRHASAPPAATLFGDDHAELLDELRTLRIAYAVPNEAFCKGYISHLPKAKSVAQGVIHEAAVARLCLDREEYLDLGTIDGVFRIHVLPIYTPAMQAGPKGESAVVALVQPCRPPKAPKAEETTLF